VRLEEMVIGDHLAKDMIDYQILRYCILKQMPVIALAAEDNIMIDLEVVDKSCRAVQVWRLKRGEY
jgi:hypothetical protein